MLDIKHKYPTLRTVVAEAGIRVQPATAKAIREGKIPKGDPFEVARVAGILAAKQTPLLIPYCHPIPISHVGMEFTLGEGDIRVTATVSAIAVTGVEMEALTAASVAALTIYDMLKMLDENLIIEAIRLVQKRGGKSDFAERPKRQIRAAVLVMSDGVAAGKNLDTSGTIIKGRLLKEGLEVVEYRVIPDDRDRIVEQLKDFADHLKLDLVLTTGGTGFGPRDTTPEAMSLVTERDVPGISEAVRAFGQERTPNAMLSRARAGLRGTTLIVNLPGSPRGVTESLDLLFPAIFHAFPMIWGERGWEQSAEVSRA